VDANILQTNAIRKWAHDAIAAIVRPASVAVFAGQLFEFALAWYGYIAGWRLNDNRDNNFWHIFYLLTGGRLGLLFPTIALACLGTIGLLAILRLYLHEKTLKNTTWCLLLNFATIVLLLLSPAMQAA
jgi:hypothetical protein